MSSECKVTTEVKVEGENEKALMIPSSSEEDGSETISGTTGSASGLDWERERWANKAEFVLSCVGFAVGLGNIWRFPYLCYRNGGGAFLLPYVLCLVCGGIPVFMLEVALGQFMSKGGVGVWNICPLFKGIGIATTVIVFLLNIYYIVVLAWDVFYMVMSFTSVLPWSHCNNPWNNASTCVTQFFRQVANCTYWNRTAGVEVTVPVLAANATPIFADACVNATQTDPVVEFFNNRILQISSGVDEPGYLVWELAVSLLVVWIVCYCCIFKGVKSTGKVVYFTATFPYVVLLILFVRGITLDGAYDGILYYLKPDFSRLADAQVWIDAGTQIFFSYAIALGALTALGSYNKFHNDFYMQSCVVAGINSFTSLFGGLVVFSVLGFMAKQQGKHISTVADKGPGLVFIAYPKAVAMMPSLQPMFAVLFFFMIILLGLDSQFVGVEAFVTAVHDLFPQLFVRKHSRPVFIGLVSAVSYLIGLSMCTQGGMYVFQIFDYYAASGSALLFVCFWQSIAIGWVYGADRFYKNIEDMIGYQINPWLKICWKFLTPAITAGVFMFATITFVPVTYDNYVYPHVAVAFGYCLAVASMVCIPGWIIFAVLRGGPCNCVVTIKTLCQPVFTSYQHQKRTVSNSSDSSDDFHVEEELKAITGVRV